MITIKTLLSISSEKVARYIDEGYLLNIDYELNSKLSNAVFTQLNNNFPLTRKTNEEIAKKFNCTCIEVPRDVYEYTLNMLQSQNFVEVSILYPSSYKVMKHGRQLFVLKTPEEVVTKMLNPETQKQLKMFSLCGEGLEYPMGWMGKISSLLPSLTSLVLPKCQIDQIEFQVLCRSFKNLQNLDISHSGIRNLIGISNLEHLEILNLHAVPFQSKEDIAELFTLSKLRVLDISGEPSKKVSTLHQFVNLELKLPALKFLDCSFNKSNKSIFIKLFSVHDTIDKISIVGTRVIITPIKPAFLDGSVTVLTCFDLKSSLSTLFHYTKTKLIRYPTTQRIYERIETFLNFYQDERDIQRCFALLLSIGKSRFEDRETMTGVITCLQLWCSKYGTTHISRPYKNALIHILYSAITQNYIVDPNKTQLGVLFNAWAVATTPGLFDTTSSDIIDRYCVNVAQKIAKRTAIVGACLRFLKKHIHRMSPENFRKLTNDPAMRIGIYKMMRSANHFKIWELCFDIYRILKDNSDIRKEDQKQNEQEIRTLIISLTRLTPYPENQIIILNYLENLVDTLNPKSFHQFFEKEEFQIAILLFGSEHTGIITRSVSLYVKLWYLKNPRGRVHPFIYDKSKNEPLVNAIIKAWRNYPKSRNLDKDFIFFLGSHMDKPHPGAHRFKFWAEWTLMTVMYYREQWFNKCGIFP